MADHAGGQDDETPVQTWSEAVAPIVAKFEVAAALDMTASWNAVGSRATGKLMKEMARRLDEDAVEAIRARDEIIESITAKNARLVEIGQDALAGIKARDAEITRLGELVRALGGDPEEKQETDADERTAHSEA
jgi:hypothetical protein